LEKVRIKYEDLALADTSSEQPVKYQGKLFSGVAFKEDELNYYEYEYKNGWKDGRSFGLKKRDEELVFQEIYNDGIPNGEFINIIEDKKIRIHQQFDNGFLIKKTINNFEGILLLELDEVNDKEVEYDYFGNMIRERIKEVELYFFDSRESCFAKRLGYDYKREKYIFEFNQKLILNNVDKLNSMFHWYPISLFIDKLMEEDNYYSMKFLHDLITHTDEYFKSESAYFLGELGIKMSIPYLQKEIDNLNKPQIEKRFESDATSNSLTIGQRAQDAINKINKKNSFWYMLYKIAMKN